MSDAILPPRDLRGFKEIPIPKFKKDYAGKLLQITEPLTISRWNQEKRKFEDIPDPIVPTNAIANLHSRDVIGKDHPVTLRCRWPCPTCGHEHERSIPETWLNEGKARFVEEDTEHVRRDNPNGPVVYLACPYTHPDSAVRQGRWLEVSRAAAWLMTIYGCTVFSPISMGHPISVMSEHDMPHDFAYWQNTAFAFLPVCNYIMVLLLSGWDVSPGVAAEVAHARKLGLSIYTLLRDDSTDTYTVTESPNLFGRG